MGAPDISSTTAATYEGMQGRILEMLGNGMSPEVTSAALGVSAGYISQLVSTEEFARQVAERRFTNLQAATTRDRKYDSLEDKLAEKLEDLIPLMFKPMEVLRAIATVNALKRRGAGAPEAGGTINQTIVQLTLPAAITSRFITDVNNTVVAAGEQELVTIQATQLSARLAARTTGALPQPQSQPAAHNQEYNYAPSPNPNTAVLAVKTCC